MKTSPALHQLLKEELASPALDEYTVVVMARRDMERGDDVAALSRLRIDCDKFVVVAPLLCQAVKNWHEELEAEQLRWTQPPAALSPSERFWVHS
jgi:hypothetical protein